MIGSCTSCTFHVLNIIVELNLLELTGTLLTLSNCAFVFFFNLYANVQLVKRDIVTAVIDFHYVKRDPRLSVYGGVILKRVCA